MEESSHRELMDALSARLPNREDMKDIVEQAEREASKYADELTRQEIEVARQEGAKKYIG